MLDIVRITQKEPISPSSTKRRNPLLKAIDSFVDEHVPVEPFSERVNNEMDGAPAVHPRMMLKILFYSYAKGVYSSREMEDRMRWDPNYIYLSANQRVDHSTICNFILKYGEEIKRVFSQLVYVMAKMGYVSMDFVAVDGTKIKADADKRFTGDVKEFKEKKSRIEKKIERILHHTMDERPEFKARGEKILDSLEREKAKIQTFLDEVEKGEATANGKVSLTDRDACMVKDKDSKYMGYNCQIAVQDIRDMTDCGLIRHYGYYIHSDLEMVRAVLQYEQLLEKRLKKPLNEEKLILPRCKMCGEQLPVQLEGKKGRPREYCQKCESARREDRYRKWRIRRKALLTL